MLHYFFAGMNTTVMAAICRMMKTTDRLITMSYYARQISPLGNGNLPFGKKSFDMIYQILKRKIRKEGGIDTKLA